MCKNQQIGCVKYIFRYPLIVYYLLNSCLNFDIVECFRRVQRLSDDNWNFCERYDIGDSSFSSSMKLVIVAE